MSDDSDPVVASSNSAPSDLSPVIGGIAKQVPFKLLIFVFVIYIFLSSDVFIKRILSKVNGAVGFQNSPTTYGTLMTGVLLVIFVALTDQLLKRNVI